MRIQTLFRRIISLSFAILLFIVPLLFTLVNDELFEFNKMLAVYAITILIGACWTCLCFINKKIIWKSTPFDIPILLFTASQVLSTLFSIDIHTSLFGYYTRFNGGLLSLLSYVFLYYMFVIFVKKEEIHKYINWMLAGGIFSALYAFPEHFGHSFSCLIFSGAFDDACWVQDVKTRVFGTFGQPNWLAAYLGMLIPLAIVNTRSISAKIKLLEDQTPQWLSSTIRLSIVFLFSAVLLFTGSRSGMGAVGAGLVSMISLTVVFIFLIYKKKTTKLYAESVKQYSILLVITCVIFSACIFIFPNPVKNKLISLLPTRHPQNTEQQQAPTSGTQLESGGSESGQIRNVVWRGALLVWQRYPIFGSGVETFAYSYYKDRLKEHNSLSEWDFLYNKAHNEFLNYLATTGIVGLVSYLILLIYIVVYAIINACKPLMKMDRTKNEYPEITIRNSFLLASLASGIIIISISNFFGFSTVMVSVLLFLYAALISIITLPKEKPEPLNESELSFSHYAIISLLLFFFALPIYYVKQMWSADVAYAKGKQLNSMGQYNNAAPLLQKAAAMVPNEPTYHDEYSNNLTSLAFSLAQQKNASDAGKAATTALQESDKTIDQNKVHVNFWKTRVRVFLTLGQMNQSFYTKGQEALLTAQRLSPTDPKLVYYLALVSQTLGDDTGYERYLLQAIDLKPNYEEARTALAALYEQRGQREKALAQYQYMIQFINPNNQVAKSKIASLSAGKK